MDFEKKLEIVSRHYADADIDYNKHKEYLRKIYIDGFRCGVEKANIYHCTDTHKWHEASDRPPKSGRYLVWGLTEFVPDHTDQPNTYWQTRIASFYERSGWDTTILFWRELPTPPSIFKKEGD